MRVNYSTEMTIGGELKKVHMVFEAKKEAGLNVFDLLKVADGTDADIPLNTTELCEAYRKIFMYYNYELLPLIRGSKLKNQKEFELN